MHTIQLLCDGNDEYGDCKVVMQTSNYLIQRLKFIMQKIKEVLYGQKEHYVNRRNLMQRGSSLHRVASYYVENLSLM